MKEMTDKILKDYLLGKLTPKEAELLDRWLRETPENARKWFDYENMYLAGKPNSFGVEAVLQERESDLANRLRSYGKAHRRSRVFRIFRYAALFLLLAALGGGAFVVLRPRQSLVCITAPANGVKRIMLPDSTIVWLNKQASIRYPERFLSEKRVVGLSGEALFEVRKDPRRPFIVSSEAISVRVLGTTFNINTDCKGRTEEVSLIEGSLEVTGNHDEGKIIIRPNQKAILDKKTHFLEVKNEYAPLEAIWHNDLIPFKNMRMAEISAILEKLYKVEITLAAGIDIHQTYTGSIQKGDDVDTVLDRLAYAIPFRFERKGNKVTLFGR